MDSFLRNNKMKAKQNKENDDTEITSADANSQEAMNKLKKISNAARIKQAKIFRSEVINCLKVFLLLNRIIKM
jgi:hypothetical protein